MSIHIYTYIDPPVEKDILTVTEALSRGGVIAYPSDTNWAFACDASSRRGLERMRRLKPGHLKDKPFSLVCESIAMVSSVAQVDNQIYRVLKKTLPGPFTYLLQPSRALPRQIHDKRRVVGVKVPNSPLALAIVRQFEKPLASTSAPQLDSGYTNGTSFARHGFDVFEEFGHGLDIVIDLGEELTGEESTIVDITSGYPKLVRSGAGSWLGDECG